MSLQSFAKGLSGKLSATAVLQLLICLGCLCFWQLLGILPKQHQHTRCHQGEHRDVDDKIGNDITPKHAHEMLPA